MRYHRLVPGQLASGPVWPTAPAAEGVDERGRASGATAVLDRLELTWDDLDTDPAPLVVSLATPPDVGPIPGSLSPARPSADEAWVLGEPVVPWPVRAAGWLGGRLSSWSGDRSATPVAPTRPATPRPGVAATHGLRHAGTSRPPHPRRWAGPLLLLVGLLLVVAGAVRWWVVRVDGGSAPAVATTVPVGPALLPPATTAPPASATAPPSSLPPAATTPPAPTIEAGESFSHPCAVDPGTTPVRTANSVELQMACLGLPLDIAHVQVIYGDPGLDPAAFDGTVTVTGQVVEVERSPAGTLVPIVVADRIIF